MIAVTDSQIVQAFEDWENDYRLNPASYYTSEETASAAVSQVSIERMQHFVGLIRKREADAAANHGADTVG